MKGVGPPNGIIKSSTKEPFFHFKWDGKILEKQLLLVRCSIFFWRRAAASSLNLSHA